MHAGSLEPLIVNEVLFESQAFLSIRIGQARYPWCDSRAQRVGARMSSMGFGKLMAR